MTGLLAAAAMVLALVTVCHDQRDAAIRRVLSSIRSGQALTKPPTGEIAYDPGEPMIDPMPGGRR